MRVNSKNNILLIMLIFGVTISYLVIVLPFFSPPTSYLTNDNGTYHLRSFTYFSNMLLYFGSVPSWYPWNGGLPVGVTSVSLFPLLPHRIISYLLYLVVPVSSLVMYKVNLLIGMALIGGGWYLFVQRYLSSNLAATVSTLFLLISGAGVSIFHQEQIIATMTYMPWMLFCLVKTKENPYWLVGSMVLACLGLTTHFPQVFLIGLIFLLVHLGLAGYLRAFPGWVRREISVFMVGAILGLLALAPAYILHSELGNFASPLRSTESLTLATIDDYILVNKMQVSSAPIDYLKNLVFAVPMEEYPNGQFGFFFSSAGWILIAIGVVTRFRSVWPYLITSIGVIWAVLGINFGFAQLLFHIRFPFIDVFRQWYHFFPFLQFILSLLVAYGVSELVNVVRRSTTRKQREVRRLAVLLILGVCIALALIQSFFYFRTYYVPRIGVAVEAQIESRLSALEFNEYVEHYWSSDKFNVFQHEPLMLYKEWGKFLAACDSGQIDARWRVAEGLSRSEVQYIFDVLCDRRNDPRPILASWDQGTFVIKNLDAVDFEFNGRSMTTRIRDFPSQKILVFPLVYDMGMEVEIEADGQTMAAKGLFGNAVTIVRFGESNKNETIVRVSLERDYYSWAVGAQLVAVLFGFFIIMLKRKQHLNCRKLSEFSQDDVRS